ncbi:MAG: glycosyltransferase family 4 protein [Planctomycetes bacterium]|nr:glycosyltransferase family 4 protein [Planctomycetota bacterium]
MNRNGSGDAEPREAPRAGASADLARGGAPIGYLLKCFPRLSETFILNEILELERQGLPLRIYSMNEPQEPVRHRLFSRVRSPISYLPFPLLAEAAAYLRAHLPLLLRHPLRYLATLASVLASFDRDLLERFVQAGEVARLARRDGVRHLHAGFVHFPGSVAWLVHRLTGLPFSLATHARDLALSKPSLLRRKVAAARLVLTCNGYNVPALEALAGPGGTARLRHIYHGADLERFRFEPCGLADPPLVLAVGRLVEKKGIDDLVSACALLRDRGRRFQCRIIAGSRDRWNEIEAQIRALRLESAVLLDGPLDQEEVRGWYREASVFALPCRLGSDGDRDGVPNVLVEAAASGVPIVSTPVSGIPELVRDGETGLVVPPRDPSALASAIERLLESPELRARLREGARALVEERFDLRRNGAFVARELLGAADPGSSPARLELETVAS